MPTSRTLWLMVTAGLLSFGALAWDYAMRGPLYAMDGPIDTAMTQTAAKGWPIHPVGEWGSLPGSASVALAATLAVVAWLLLRNQRGLAGWALAGATTTSVLVGFLKPAFGRTLPPHIAAVYPRGLAFPSGHTLGATATLGILIFMVVAAWCARLGASNGQRARAWRIGWWAWGLTAFVVGVSRVLAQHHWATDVLASWSLGVALVAAALLASGVASQDGSQEGPL